MSGISLKITRMDPEKNLMANNIKIKDNRSTYPGGKGGSGVYQNIINLIPPHDVYIETHLGGGSILRHKRPAQINIGIDLDQNVIECWARAGITKLNGFSSRRDYSSTTIKKMVTARAPLDKNIDSPREKVTGSNTNGNNEWRRKTSPFLVSGDEQYFTVINADATRWLKKYQFTGNEFIYVDPPYLFGVRKGGKLYDCEMTDQQHIELISYLRTIPTKIMISGYWSSLYSEMLPGWNTFSFQAQTRQGMATEWLWFNYPFPDELHDYSYLGSTFRDRERIKKKRNRWVARLLRTPVLERNAIIKGLMNCSPDPSSPEKQIAAGNIKNDGADRTVKNGDPAGRSKMVV